MKIALVIAAGTVVLLSGCASVGPAPATQLTASDSNVDWRKMAAVDSVARARGVTVKWINLPEKVRAPSVAPALADPTGT